MAKRSGIMLPVPFDEKRFEHMTKPVIVQPKLEGDRLRAFPDATGGIHLRSSGDKERVSVPHIHDSFKVNGLDWELDGELWVPGMRHKDIRSIVSRTKNLHHQYFMMEYHVYDIISNEDQDTRLHRLQDLRGIYAAVYIVPRHYVYTIEQLQGYYDDFLLQGYEGIIIRHPDRPYKRSQVPWMLKLKPRLSGEYEIVVVEPVTDKFGSTRYEMGSFILKDEEGKTFSVGTGPKAMDRLLFWRHREQMIGKKCKIRYQALTSARGVPKMQSIDKDWLKEMRSVLR